MGRRARLESSEGQAETVRQRSDLYSDENEEPAAEGYPMRAAKTRRISTPPPASTPDARESQMIALAMDLVEQRLRNGSASSQETTHFLKLAANRELDDLNIQLAQKDLELKEAKRKAIQSAERIEELYTNALEAMRRYSGAADQSDDYGREQERRDRY